MICVGLFKVYFIKPEYLAKKKINVLSVISLFTAKLKKNYVNTL